MSEDIEIDISNNDIETMPDKEFIKKFEKLVKSIAYQYKNTGLAQEDLVQEGMIGLIEAKKRFISEKGASFSTYASYWIKNRILKYISQEFKQNHNTEFIENIDYTHDNPVEKDYRESKKNKGLNLPEDMPDLEKKVIILSFVEKKSLNEIADMLNIPREKARQIKAMAMRRYKSNIENLT